MHRKSHWASRMASVVLPLAAIVVGSVVLVRDVGAFDVGAFQHWWPLGLVVAGVALLCGRVVHMD